MSAGSPCFNHKMAPLLYFNFRKVLMLCLVLFLFSNILLCASSEDQLLERKKLFGRRRLLEIGEEDEVQIKPKKKSTNLSIKNQTKLVKPISISTKNQTKLIKPSLSSTNQTKIAKSTNSTKLSQTTLSKTELKKLNSTSNLKKLNSTSKPSSIKNTDPLKLGSSKNKTTKAISAKPTQTLIDKKLTDQETKKQTKNQKTNTTTKPTTEKKPTQKKTEKQQQASWLYQDDEDDLVKEFRDLPARFQQTLIPDLERISMTSKKYLNKANKEITRGFKPYVGNKYAPTIATIVSFAFIIIPLILVSLIFNEIKAYFSLQKVLIFIQVYLSIYFSILCLSSLVTGLEPLRFFYATAQSTYVCLMVLQTLCYLLYLLLLLMYLVLVFSTDCGLESRMLSLGQTIVGFAVGLHYYVAVFHRVVLHQPPKTNWKIHGLYATCFLVICLLSRAERRKKAYLEEGGEEGKKN